MSEEELKPCPFCGNQPEISMRADCGYPEIFHDCLVLEDIIDILDPNAIERWNTRPIEDELEEYKFMYEGLYKFMYKGLE